MKKIILVFVMALSMSFVFGQQTCELRVSLDPSNPNPQVGEDFLVNVWLDVLSYPTSPDGVSSIKSAALMLDFDDAVMTLVKTSGPPPTQKWYWNLSQMLTDYAAAPNVYNNAGGDLRAIFYTTTAPGIDPQWYNGTPIRLWDYKFHYNGGGPIELTWGTTSKLVAQPGSEIGGKLEKAITQVTAWDNSFYPLDALVNLGGVAAPIDYVWNGSVNSNFTEPLNWTPNGVPGDNDALDTATIPAGTPLCASSAADHTFAALTIEAGGSAALSAMSFHITGDMTVDAGGFFYMGLDPATNKPGSLVVDGNFAGNGLFAYGYYIPNGDIDWHAVSSPLPVSTDNPDMFNGWDGFMNDIFLNYWDEVNNTFVHVDNGDSCAITQFDFVPGFGGFILLDDTWATDPCNIDVGGPNTGTINYSGGLPQFIEFSGLAATVNNGDIAYPMTYTAGGSYEGWNLVGNPFPGTFDITATSWAAGVDQSVYAFDGTNYVSGTSAGVGNVLMPAGQGFFVHTANAATFNFDKAAVVMATNAALKSETNILKLRATDGQYEDVTYINLDKEATASFDSQRDAYKKFTPVEAVPQMYTQSVEGTNLSINSFDMLEETMNLFFRAGVNGSFTIDAVEVGTYSTVILEDTFTGVMTNLLTDAYSFEYNTTDTDARFILHFAPLGVSEVANQGIEIYSNQSTIYVNIDNTDASSIVVYDLLGQEVLRTSADQGMNTIEMNDDNYYLVSVILSDNVVNAKVFVK